jgi:hypothetical protein
MINQHSAHVLLIGIAPIMMDSNEVKIVVSSDLGFIKFAIAARLLIASGYDSPETRCFDMIDINFAIDPGQTNRRKTVIL